MKVFSVVGNRPQFIKAAPTSVALRERGIDEVVLHTGQHYDPELSQVFFEELGLEEPRYPLDLRSADTEAMRAAIAAPLADGAARLGAGLRRHELDPRRRARRGRRRRAARARRGRPAQRRPVDAGRAEPNRDRPTGPAAPHPGRALPEATRRRGRLRPCRGRRRRDGRRVVSPHAGRPGALARARGVGARPGRLPLAHDSPRGEHGARTPRADRRGHPEARGAGRLPGSPAHARSARRGKARARPARSRSSRRSVTST